MPVIVADEIVEQLDAIPGTDISGFLASWYGVVAPPFANFWIEARTVVGREVIQRGVLCSTLDNKDGRYAHVRGRWAILMDGFFYTEAVGVLGYAGTIIVDINAEGYMADADGTVRIMEHRHWYEHFKPRQILPAMGPRGMEGLASHAVYALKAIGAMHRRVEVSEITPTRQARRLSERKTGITLHPYYLLKVAPYEPKSVEDFKHIGTPERTTAIRSEHIVRGHFRYYHPDRPMFGRADAVGMVWIPDHERGDPKKGKTQKGYQVE